MTSTTSTFSATFSATVATTCPCLGQQCHATVMSGRGYCGRCGGPGRLQRELEEAARVNREERAPRLRAPRPPNRRPERPRFTPGDSRGCVAPGQGLGRFSRRAA